jgi:hypothetical protein
MARMGNRISKERGACSIAYSMQSTKPDSFEMAHKKGLVEKARHGKKAWLEWTP